MKDLEIKTLENSLQDDKAVVKKIMVVEASDKEEKTLRNEAKTMNTPYDCLQSVLGE